MSIRRRETGRSSSYVPWLIVGGVILAFVLMVGLLARQPRVGGASVGSHWHAPYTIEICGRTFGPMPQTPGDVHTHGDGVMHIHPSTAAAAGRNANLQAFFRFTPVQLGDARIEILGDKAYRNGDKCPDGKAGRLRVLVKHAGETEFTEVKDFLRYTPRDRETIRVIFGP